MRKSESLSVIKTVLPDVVPHFFTSEENLDPLSVFSGKRISVRSNPPVSMPGILDTVLGVDLSNENAESNLGGAIKKVTLSYEKPAASNYLKRLGFANVPKSVIFQEMVGENGGIHGVLFTADPESHECEPIVVASEKISEVVSGGNHSAELFAGIHRRLIELGHEIESVFGYPQDIEFCVDRSGKIWVLQSRDVVFNKEIADSTHLRLLKAGRTTKEKVKSKMKELPAGFDEKVVSGVLLEQLTPAVAGVGCGTTSNGPLFVPYILLTDDLNIQYSDWTNCVGIISGAGNAVCHASIIARKLGIPCIIGKTGIAAGAEITIDGSSGSVYLGKAETAQSDRKKAREALVTELNS